MIQILETKLQTLLNKQVTRVHFPWTKNGEVTNWNEACAWAIEQFGFPGDKFRVNFIRDYMEFIFYNEEDAIYFSLRWL